jgi:pimeloyl-ACP methyl ester carboxylesterase
MSYLEAVRWARPLRQKRGEIVAKLASLDSIPKLDERPLLLVYGDQDGVIPAERALRQAQDVARAALGEEIAQGKLKSLPGEGHLSLPRSPAASALVARWFKENL